MPGAWAGVREHRVACNPLADMVDPGVHPVVANMRLMGQRKANLDLGRFGIEDPAMSIQQLPKNQRAAQMLPSIRARAPDKGRDVSGDRGKAKKKKDKKSKDKKNKKAKKKKRSSSSSSSTSSSSSSSSTAKRKQKKKKKKEKKDGGKEKGRGKEKRKEDAGGSSGKAVAKPLEGTGSATASRAYDAIWVFDEAGADPDRQGEFAGELRFGELTVPGSGGGTLPVTPVSDLSFSIKLDRVYTARLEGDRLLWDDGDVWRRFVEDAHVSLSSSDESSSGSPCAAKRRRTKG